MNEITAKNIKRSKTLYIFEAAFEYLISILVSGSFLAILTKDLGVSDSLTGLLSSVNSLGCLFQLLSLSIRRMPVKRTVIMFSVINQVLFMLLYVIPLADFEKKTKAIMFAVVIFAAYLIYNMVHPKKIDWLMSMIEYNHRGSFTASKEIISLIFGMIFTFGMGAVVDYFSDTGKIRTAFILLAVVIFALMVLHSLTMIFSAEKKESQNTVKNIKHTVIELAKNKNTVNVTVVFLLYYISVYVSVPFYGTYQISELGFNLKFVSLLTICGSISRILVSKFWGNYADKKSFAAMTEKCFIFLGLAQLCVVFAVPSTGKIMFMMYYVFHGIAMGGINSAFTNLVIEYAPDGTASDALAVTQAAAGFTGFLSTFISTWLVSYIQNNGCSIFGHTVFAQQLVSVIALAFTVSAVLYTKFIFNKKR